MSHFDATNVLSDEKRSDYGYYYKENATKWQDHKEKSGDFGDSSFQMRGKPWQHKPKAPSVPAEAVNDKTVNKDVTKELATELTGITVNYKTREENTTPALIKKHKHKAPSVPAGTADDKTVNKELNKKLTAELTGTTVTYNATEKTKTPVFINKPNVSITNSYGNTVFPETSKTNVSLREIQSQITESRGLPYVTVLSTSTAVLAVSFLTLLALYIYRRRHNHTSVITDEMYNEYKLNKRMQSRSPLPSPRGSSQEKINCEYDFINIEDMRPDETEVKMKPENGFQTEESVYLELDDSVRYDYATLPDAKEDSVLTTRQLHTQQDGTSMNRCCHGVL